MVTLHWKARSARVWLSEPPAWDYEISEVVEDTQEALKEERVSAYRSAVELFFPIGARFYYGGIAVTFTPNAKGNSPFKCLLIQPNLVPVTTIMQQLLVSLLSAISTTLLFLTSLNCMMKHSMPGVWEHPGVDGMRQKREHRDSLHDLVHRSHSTSSFSVLIIRQVQKSLTN